MAYQIVDNTSHAVTLNRYNLPLLVCGVLSDIKSLHVTYEYSCNCQHKLTQQMVGEYVKFFPNNTPSKFTIAPV